MVELLSMTSHRRVRCSKAERGVEQGRESIRGIHEAAVECLESQHRRGGAFRETILAGYPDSIVQQGLALEAQSRMNTQINQNVAIGLGAWAFPPAPARHRDEP
jgi:hypothetical protein